MKKILITGTAGFIGFHLARVLMVQGHDVTGVDSINDYYDVRLKHGRLLETGIAPEKAVYGKKIISRTHPNYSFIKLNLEDRDAVTKLFSEGGFDTICHLAAQAGVRYSLTNPFAYIESNLSGFINILEGCRRNLPAHLVYASSSSVYGLNETMPFSTGHNVDHPVSLYAATKKSNELMAHAYSHLYNIPSTGLRFFTVYGPWGRPDMALFIFTKAILEGKTIDIYNHGEMSRDFTYIDDITASLVRVMEKPAVPDISWNGAVPDPASSKAPYKIYNIGNNSPVKLMDFIDAIEEVLGRTAKKNFLKMQKGDVAATWADVSDLIADIDYTPNTPVRDGIKRFIDWYRHFYRC